MPLYVVVLLKGTSYHKETKREAENKRQENERNQSGDEKALMADSAPDPLFSVKLTQNPFTAPGWNKKETYKKTISIISNHELFWLVKLTGSPVVIIVS